MELSLLILVCIHKSYIVYLEIYVVPIGHGFSFFGYGKVMENQCWKRGGTLLNFIIHALLQSRSRDFQLLCRATLWSSASMLLKKSSLLGSRDVGVGVIWSQLYVLASFIVLSFTVSNSATSNDAAWEGFEFALDVCARAHRHTHTDTVYTAQFQWNSCIIFDTSFFFKYSVIS